MAATVERVEELAAEWRRLWGEEFKGVKERVWEIEESIKEQVGVVEKLEMHGERMKQELFEVQEKLEKERDERTKEVEQQGIKEMEWGERMDNGERNMESIWEEIKEIKKVVMEMEMGKHLFGGLIGKLGEVEGKVDALVAAESGKKYGGGGKDKDGGGLLEAKHIVPEEFDGKGRRMENLEGEGRDVCDN